MQHARQAHIVDETRRAADLARQIDARDRLADDAILFRSFERRFQSDAALEFLSAQQLGIGDRPIRDDG